MEQQHVNGITYKKNTYEKNLNNPYPIINPYFL